MAEEKKVVKKTVSPKKETTAPVSEEKAVKAPSKKATPKVKEEKPEAKVETPVAKDEPKVVTKEKPVKAEVKVEPKTASKEKSVKTESKPKDVQEVKIPARIKEHYLNVVVPSLMKQFNYKSIMEVPALNKIVVNIGVGDATGNPKLLEESVRELGDITGQKPVITKAKLSIANFKLREGQAIGTKVTLRGDRMYQFFDKLITIALPRVRDFRGVSKNAFDGRGNYTFGVKEQLIFPEIDFDRVTKIRGMDIVIVTTAKTDKEARALLQELGVPFQK